MLTGINPFKTGQDLTLVEKMNEILNKEIPIPKKLSVEARDLLKQILRKNVSYQQPNMALVLINCAYLHSLRRGLAAERLEWLS